VVVYGRDKSKAVATLKYRLSSRARTRPASVLMSSTLCANASCFVTQGGYQTHQAFVPQGITFAIVLDFVNVRILWTGSAVYLAKCYLHRLRIG
jgi:hypothetical protein